MAYNLFWGNEGEILVNSNLRAGTHRSCQHGGSGNSCFAWPVKRNVSFMLSETPDFDEQDEQMLSSRDRRKKNLFHFKVIRSKH